MRPVKRLFIATFAFSALSAGLWAENPNASDTATGKTSAAPAPSAAAVTEADWQALKKVAAAQQLELLSSLRQPQPAQQETAGLSRPVSNAAPQQQIAANSSGSQPGGAAKPSPDPEEDLPPSQSPMEGPLTIHYRGINFTPGGYAAAEFVRRSRALSADLSTPFSSVTMPGASQSEVSEFFGSARQSKITGYVNGRLKNVDLESYVSADFLSAGVTSTSTSTNSYTLRLRQAWGRVHFIHSGWSFVGGQMWSLATENKKSIQVDDDLGKTNDARPKTIDPSYNVGFVFARQYGIRLVKYFGNTMAFGVAMENAQGTLTTHNNGDNFLIGQAGASNSYNTTSTYTFNPSPDLIAKAAFDPGFGHYEVFALYDRFADRIFPCAEVKLAKGATTGTCPSGVGTGPSALGAYDESKGGGGVGASARWILAKKVTFGVKGFGGSGVGRYGPGGLPDLSINANGSLHPVKNLLGLASLEIEALKKLSIYAYGGSEYAARTASYDAISGKQVGYGAPQFSNYGCYTELPPTVNTGFTPATLSNCTADTRALIEGTVGFWYRFYNGPRGRFQFGSQYSYLTRQTWSGVGFTATGPGVSPEGIDNMVFASFRYILP
jgi:hypothetical protein